MKPEIEEKVRQYFSAMSIYKDPEKTNSIFAGRNLPAFVKDYLMKRYLNVQTGDIDTLSLTQFLDQVIPTNSGSVKDRIVSGEEVVLLCRFIIYIELVKVVKLLKVIPAHNASLEEDYLRLEQMALSAKQDREFQMWLDKKIASMYIYIAPEFRNMEFSNKNWVKYSK